MATFTTNKNLIKPAYNAPDWNDPLNTDFDIIDKAFGGEFEITTSGGVTNITQENAQNVYIKITGALVSNASIKFPANVRGFYIVDNITTGAFSVILSSNGTGVGSAVAVRLASTFVYSDGDNVILADNPSLTATAPLNLTGSTLSITPPVPVNYGGTGAVSLTANSVILGNGTSTVLGVAPGTLGNVLTSNGTTWTSAAPTGGGGTGVTSLGMFTATGSGSMGLTWTSSSTNPLTTAGGFTLGGILNVPYGGTGATTLTGYVRGNGASAMTAVASVPGSDVSGAYTAAGLTVASNRLLGRASGGAGAAEEIAIGTGLSISGGTLNATSGGVTSVSASSSASGFGLASSGSTAVTVSFSISDTTNARTSLGLGSMATQAASAVAITGGTISGASSIASTGTITGNRFEIIGGQPSMAFSGGLGLLNFTTNSSFSGTESEVKCFVGGVENFKCTTTAFTLSSAISAAQCFFGTTWTNISDARVKTDVTPYTLGVSALNQLRPVDYIYNGDYGTPDNGVVQTGLIAQEVLTTPLASMVGTRVYIDPDTGVETTLYDLNTNQLVFALINAVKELSARVTALEAK